MFWRRSDRLDCKEFASPTANKLHYMVNRAMKTYELPPQIDEPGLLVGYSLEQKHLKQPIGFSFGDTNFTPERGFLDPYLFHGEGHLITVAPTGAGKGVACVVPAALRHKGDLVVMDPKGENFAITVRRRRELGQEVCLIDPFGVISARDDAEEIQSTGVNVFDFLPYLADTREAAAHALAGMIANPPPRRSDPFWDMSATNILAGLVHYYSHELEGATIADLLDDLADYPRIKNVLPSFGDQLAELVEADVELLKMLDLYGLNAADFVAAYLEEEVALEEILLSPLVDETRDTSDAASSEVSTPFDDDDADPLANALQAKTPVIITSSAFNRFREVATRLRKVEAELNEKQQLIFRFTSSGYEEIAYPTAILKMMSSQTSFSKRISSMISGTPDKTWGSMLSTLQNNLGYLNARGLRKAISGGGLDLERFRRSTGTTIYLVFPPHRLATHAQLLTTLFKGLINVLVTRKGRPRHSTLFLMDEVAQLGHVEEFVAAKTLLRGYGVQVWSFWQDLSQLQQTYPHVWPTIINNCKVFQAFGCATPMMANALQELFELPSSVIMDLEANEMLLSVYGDEPVIARKPSYFTDPVFVGMFEQNPLEAEWGREDLLSDLGLAEADRALSPNPGVETSQKPVRGFELVVKRRKVMRDGAHGSSNRGGPPDAIE